MGVKEGEEKKNQLDTWVVAGCESGRLKVKATVLLVARAKPGVQHHTAGRRASVCILHGQVVSFWVTLCTFRCWSPSDCKKPTRVALRLSAFILDLCALQHCVSLGRSLALQVLFARVKGLEERGLLGC